MKTRNIKKGNCKYFNSGNCRYGEACKFKHVNNQETKVCKFFKQGNCKYGRNCKFGHIINQNLNNQNLNNSDRNKNFQERGIMDQRMDKLENMMENFFLSFQTSHHLRALNPQVPTLNHPISHGFGQGIPTMYQQVPYAQVNR